MSPAKLPKICYPVVLATIIFTTLFACKQAQEPATQFKPFFTGKWVITTIETNETAQLDTAGRRIYNQQMAQFTDSAYIEFTDTLFTLDMGPNKSRGSWRYYGADSTLVLYEAGRHKTPLRVSRPDGSHLKLTHLQSPVNEYWLVEKARR